MRRPEDLDHQSRRILQDAGFTWDKTLGVWSNGAVGQAISMDAVINHGPGWLAAWVRKPTET